MSYNCCAIHFRSFLDSCAPGKYSEECPVCNSKHNVLKVDTAWKHYQLNGESFSFITVDELFREREFSEERFKGEHLGKWQREQCLHGSCSKCCGTGYDRTTGQMCIHGLSCPCPKCRG